MSEQWAIQVCDDCGERYGFTLVPIRCPARDHHPHRFSVVKVVPASRLASVEDALRRQESVWALLEEDEELDPEVAEDIAIGRSALAQGHEDSQKGEG